MFARPFASLLIIAALAVPAFAQEQRGAIEGIVRDASGAVLPGATVEAQSNVGPVASTITDSVGSFRFPALPPGNYKVTANLQGFVSREVVDVRLLENGRPLEVRQVRLPGNSQQVRERFRVAPSRTAATVYSVEVAEGSGELTPANNRGTVFVPPPASETVFVGPSSKAMLPVR